MIEQVVGAEFQFHLPFLPVGDSYRVSYALISDPNESDCITKPINFETFSNLLGIAFTYKSDNRVPPWIDLSV